MGKHARGLAQLMCCPNSWTREERPATGLSRPFTARLPACEGFSLIEVMVALGILAFGILAVTAAQIGTMKVSVESRNRTVALNLAEAQMEIFEVMPPADVLALTAAPGYPNDPANPIDPDPGDGASQSFDRSWDIQPGTPEPGVMTITVSVAWTDGLGKLRSERVQTLKVDS